MKLILFSHVNRNGVEACNYSSPYFFLFSSKILYIVFLFIVSKVCLRVLPFYYKLKALILEMIIINYALTLPTKSETSLLMFLTSYSINENYVILQVQEQLLNQ